MSAVWAIPRARTCERCSGAWQNSEVEILVGKRFWCVGCQMFTRLGKV